MSVKYAVAAFQFGALLKDEKGLKDYGTAVMQGNIWRQGGVYKDTGSRLEKVDPDSIMVFEVDAEGKYTVVREWSAEVGGVL